MGVASQIDSARGGANLVLQRVDRAAEQLAKCLSAALFHELGRIELIGERENSQIHLRGDEQLQNVVGAALPRGVSVEYQINGVSKSLEQANVPLIQCRAAAGHDVVNAVLMAQNHVGIAFDDR